MPRARMTRARTALILSLACPFTLTGALGGCGGTQTRDRADARSASVAAPRPAKISHVVLVTLRPEFRSDAAISQLRAEALSDLATIPGVVRYAAGPHLDTGRATVTDGYDLGLYIGFDTVAEYDAYVTHPRHEGFVERWRPKTESLVVYDFADGL